MRGWIARVKVPPCAKFGDPSSKGVGARGQKAEMLRPAGALLHPRGGSTPWHSSQTKALLA